MDRDTTGTSKVTKKNQAANISSSRVALSLRREEAWRGRKWSTWKEDKPQTGQSFKRIEKNALTYTIFFFKEEQTVKKKTVTIKKRKTKDLKYDKKYFQL